MSQSLVKAWIHLVFSTKHRRPYLRNEEVREQMHRYLATCLKSLDSPARIVNGTEDHVHALFSLSRNHAIKTIVERVKPDCTRWVRRTFRASREFAWQSGYGAFSVSESRVESVRRYIRDQERHHARMSFKEEFRRICQQHGVELDETHAWT